MAKPSSPSLFLSHTLALTQASGRHKQKVKWTQKWSENEREVTEIVKGKKDRGSK